MQRLTIDNKLEGPVRGLRDYTRNLWDSGQFYEHELNRPAQFKFKLQDAGDTDFVIPARGSYVVFEDDRFETRDFRVPDGILFTGYIADDPKPVMLGDHNGTTVWGFEVVCTSEDYLPQIKEIPVKTYVNKTRGFIIRDLIQTMFQDATTSPLDVSGVQDGGVERLFQTERTKKFADLLADFAKADAYRYRVLNGCLYYEPMEELWPGSSDPERKLTVDELDPRWSPHGLQMDRVATSICNDVTVFGLEEPTTLVKEGYVSDGYMGEFQLLHRPYGSVERILIEDDYASPDFDSGVWEEVDDEEALTGLGDGSYLQLFEGSFNLVGGPQDMRDEPDQASRLALLNEPQIFLRARKGIELSGIIETRDAELNMNSPTVDGQAMIGGIYANETMGWYSIISGWFVNVNDPLSSTGSNTAVLTPITGSLIATNLRAYVMNKDYSYILRRRFEFDLPVGLPVVRRGPLGTDIEYGEVTRQNDVTIYYTIEEINASDPQNVITTKHELGTTRVLNCPDFALYAGVVNYCLTGATLNFCKIHRPQQVLVTVDGLIVTMGDFIDGGHATVTVQDNKAKLAWYAVPTTDEAGAVTPTPAGGGVPWAYWPLGDTTQAVRDSGSNGFHMTAVPNVTSTTGAPNAGDEIGKLLPGVPVPGWVGSIEGPVFGNPYMSLPPGNFSITAWVKTSQANGPIFMLSQPGNLSGPIGYVCFDIYNGRLRSKIEYPENAISGTIAINDDQWHLVALVHASTAGAPGTTTLYVDGAVDATGAQHLTTYANGIWSLGHDNCFWPSMNTWIETYYAGTLDEVAIHDEALSDTAIQSLFTGTQAPPTNPTPSSAYNPQTGTTIPPRGSRVSIQYYRAQASRARIKSTESIATERSLFGDDGIRQQTILEGETVPVPRTSEECQYLAQAYLADRALHRYEGTYTFQTGERDITRLNYFPAPGDMIPMDIELPNGEVLIRDLQCTQVSSEFMGEGAYEITIGFGPINRWDEAQRRLLLARRSSLDTPEIKDQDVLIAEDLMATGYAIPHDPPAVAVTQVTPLTFTVNMNPSIDVTPGGYGSGGGVEVNATLPDGVVGYEIRREDNGWGQPNYVARVSTAVFALDRGKRDRAYYVRPFNSQNRYSRNSALVRVVWPLSNTIVATGLDGDVSAEWIRLFIPIDRNPDIGGYQIQRDNDQGVVLYTGDGVTHYSMNIPGTLVYVESGRVTVQWPNTFGTLTVFVRVYNLVSELGPGATFTISRPAPEA